MVWSRYNLRQIFIRPQRLRPIYNGDAVIVGRRGDGIVRLAGVHLAQSAKIFVGFIATHGFDDTALWR